MIHVAVNGINLDISTYHAEHVVDTLLGNTLHGAEGWCDTGVKTAREGMKHPDSTLGYTGHGDAAVAAYEIANAHTKLANAIQRACSEIAEPGKVNFTIDGVACMIDSSDVRHIVDTLLGWRDGGASGWDSDVADISRDYVKIASIHVALSQSLSAETVAANALGQRNAAENLARIHRELAVGLSHAASDSRHPYCDPTQCEVANARAMPVTQLRRDNV